MGNAKDCLNIAVEAAKNTMSVDEIQDILKRLEKLKKDKMAAGQLADLDKAVEKLATDMTDQAKVAAVLEKRNRIINIFAERERAAHLSKFEDNPSEGLKALNVGSQQGREGGRLSVASRQRSLQGQLMGGVMAKLQKENLLPFVRGDIDREIAIEMAQLDNPKGQLGITKIPEAKRVAQIFRDAQEASRVVQNDAGAIVRKLPGYIVNQQHAYDMFRMRRAGKEAVMRDLAQALDPEATYKGADPTEFLNGVTDGMLSGVHLKVDGPSDPTAFKGAFNLAKKMSQERVLHFKSPEAFYDFFKKYGHGSLMEAVASGLNRAADNAGIMQVWGTNPRAAFEADRQKLISKHRAKPELVDKLKSPFREYEFREVSGETRMVGSPSLAQAGSIVRGLQTLSKLGGAVVSSITDVPVLALGLRYNGKNLLEGWSDLISTRMGQISQAERSQFADLMGLGMESWMGSFASRFDAGDSVPGTMTKLVNTFFKLNLLNWWTDGWRVTAGMVLSKNLADNAGVEFGKLATDLQRALSLYDITEREWNLVRKAGKEIGGRTYITPDAIRELDDAAFKSYREGNLTPSQLRRTKSELEQKLQSYFMDQVDSSVIQPDAGTRAMLNLGTNRGTVPGEVLRLIMQFKSFPVAMLQKVAGREIYGRGAGSMRNMGSKELAGLAHIVVMGTLFGYGAMAAKDILKGRTPRDPANPASWVAAMVQGGGLGIYGDFIFGQYSRFGTSAVATAMGPTAGSVDELMKLWGRVREGDDVAATAFRTAVNHTPFANLFYTRIALDYLILYDIQEKLNPGAMVRLEKRIKSENNQSFLMPPSKERFTPLTGQ
jgi:hypothetical protein